MKSSTRERFEVPPKQPATPSRGSLSLLSPQAMNEAYLHFFQERELPVCARVYIGCESLALTADVQIDATAMGMVK